MNKPKKKPKTGDVVGWAIINGAGGVYDTYESRQQARLRLVNVQKHGVVKPYRIAKIVLAK